MQIFSLIMIIFGVCFLALSGLLIHERVTAENQNSEAPAKALRNALSNAVSSAVTAYDRDVVFGSVVPVVLFMVLPLAAFLNMLQGGSPFMILCYALIVLSVFANLLLTEKSGTGFIRALLSGTAAAAVMIVLPYYACWSLTSHILKSIPSMAAVAGIFIAVILYAANAGVWSLLHTSAEQSFYTSVHRLFASFLFAIPIGYVLYWLGLLTIDVSGLDAERFRGWGALFAFSLTFSCIFALVQKLLERSCRLLSAWGFAGLGILAIGGALALH
ncbi:hypothetical protein L2D14_10125 [Thalassospiraceae bacterium LMO-JJ14]|nr:hypothetical protein L2D14_10125 [Thalassospiraceae bacterium LMO-JJ14]